MISLPTPNIPPLLAYIDAGTFALIIQFVIAGVVGGLLFIKGWWRKTKTVFTRLFTHSRKKMIKFPKEVVNLYHLLREEKTIIIYAEHEDYYPNFEGLIKELDSPCYITSDPNDPILLEPKTYYLNKLLPFLMAFVNCNVLIMTMTDLNLFYIRRSIHPVHYVYIFHSPVSTHMIYRFGAFDHYDSILCVGPHQIEEIRRHEKLYGLKPKRLVETGYYRLERLHEAYKKYNKEEEEINVLVAPTWGPTNLLEVCGKNLLDVLLKEGYKITLRLHPETVKRKQFSSQDGITLETSVVSMDSLVKSDILITDWSGIGLEYAFGTERPVIFIDTPPKVRNPKYKELGIEPIESYLRSGVGIIVLPNELDKIPKIIQNLIANKEQYKTTIPKLRDKYIFNFGMSSEIGVDYIRSLI